MRTTLRTPPCRAGALGAAVAGLALITGAAVAGCSSGGSSFSSETGAAAGAPAAVASAPAASAAAPAAGFAASGSSGRASTGTGAAALAAAGQSLVYTAQLSVRARDVAAAVDRATSVAASAGGYVSSENMSTDPARPDQSAATVELKIPVAAYPATLARLSGTALGTQLSLRQQAQDVTQQVADVSSRAASDQAAIAQLRQLLKRAGSVSDLLNVQNQIDSQTSDLESLLAQQQALNHETAYATVTVTVIGPKAAARPKPTPAPPPGLVRGLSAGWHAFRLTIDWLLAIMGALAPFLAGLAVAGGLLWWGRGRIARWLARRGSR